VALRDLRRLHLKVLGLRRSEVVFKALKARRARDRGHDHRRVDKDRRAARPPRSPSRSSPPARRPQIDPKPILDGWKLLEAHRHLPRLRQEPLLGPRRQNPSIGQILLLSKVQLEQRVLADPPDHDLRLRPPGHPVAHHRPPPARAARVPAASGLKPYVSTLKCGHSYYGGRGGAVSEHTYGDAVDIGMESSGSPIAGHQARARSRTSRCGASSPSGTMQTNQVITLMNYAGVPYAWAQGDHRRPHPRRVPAARR